MNVFDGARKAVVLSAMLALYVGGALFAAEPVNLGPVVNSDSSDFGPIVTADGNVLYFTSDREGSISDSQDIWASRRVNGEWTKPENLGEPINTKYHEGPDSISVDQKTLYFTRCDNIGEPGICDIFSAEWDSNKKAWTNATRLGPGVNSKSFNDSNASISYDGKSLYFVSDRPREGDKRGDYDIFISKKKSGKWGKATRLGPPVNTDKDEIHVMMHQNGKTLYFSSNGHGGLGGLDVFYSNLADGKFSEPVNLGEPINTSREDLYFTLASSGDIAYFASSRVGSIGFEDIYTVPITLDLSAPKTFLLAGVVADQGTCGPAKKPAGGYDLKTCTGLADAVVMIHEKGKSEVAGRADTDKNGSYRASLPMGKDYTVSASAENCDKKTLDLTSSQGESGLVNLNFILKCKPK